MSKAEEMGEKVGRFIGWCLFTIFVYFISIFPLASYAYSVMAYPKYSSLVFTFWATLFFPIAIGKFWNTRKKMMLVKEVETNLTQALNNLNEAGDNLTESMVQEAFKDLTQVKH